MKKGFFVLLTVLAVLFMSSCGEMTEQDMPDIVFYRTSDKNNGQDDGRSIIFYDKNGACVYSDDSYVVSLPLPELMSRYASGELADKTETRSECDVNTLFENYKLMCNAIRSGNYQIKQPQELPAVESHIENWYGVYDKNGTIQLVLIHKYTNSTGLDSVSDEMNQVYLAFKNGFKVNT